MKEYVIIVSYDNEGVKRLRHSFPSLADARAYAEGLIKEGKTDFRDTVYVEVSQVRVVKIIKYEGNYDLCYAEIIGN